MSGVENRVWSGGKGGREGDLMSGVEKRAVAGVEGGREGGREGDFMNGFEKRVLAGVKDAVLRLYLESRAEDTAALEALYLLTYLPLPPSVLRFLGEVVREGGREEEGEEERKGGYEGWAAGFVSLVRGKVFGSSLYVKEGGREGEREGGRGGRGGVLQEEEEEEQQVQEEKREEREEEEEKQ